MRKPSLVEICYEDEGASRKRNAVSYSGSAA
jgi:hypothetical protein